MSDTAAEILEFMRAMERVCLVKRDTLLSDGTPENDAAHIFKLAILIMLVYPFLQKKYNYTRLLELALIHDIAEGITGDCPRSAQVAHPERQQEKVLQEQKAMQQYKKMLPVPLNERISELFNEYETRRTPEAKLVSALDKMEANFQANLFGNGDIRYWKDCENGEEYYRIATEHKPLVAELNEDILTELEKNIIKFDIGEYGAVQNKSLSITELQTAAFDWDNTLAYSREALVFAINKILPQYNLPQWDEVKQKRNRRLSFRDNFPLIFGDNAEEAYEKYRLIYKENVERLISAPPKAKEVLEFLKNNDIKIVIVSNKDRQLFDFEQHFLYSADLFDKVVCGHEAVQDKPSAEQLRYAVKGYVSKISENNVWMIGDSPMDSECALAAGAKAIRIGEPIWGTADTTENTNILFFKNFEMFYNVLTEQN